jgi:hypothetical protein
VNNGVYSPEQLHMTKNTILFTDSNLEDTKTAIGKIKFNGTNYYGINTELLIGRVLAGENLIIESSKQYGGSSVFRVDADGVKLINSVFDTFAGNSQISINPYKGIVGGLAPLYTDSDYTFNTDNVKFWFNNITGDVNIAGNANIVGNITAKNLYLGNGTVNVLNALNQINPDYLNLKGINVKNASDVTTFSVDSNGNLSLYGNITMNGGSINWSNVSDNGAYSLASSASGAASSAYNLAAAIRDGTTAIKDGSGNTFISGGFIYSPVLFGNAIIVRSNYGDDSSSGFYVQDKNDNSNIFFIRHITVAGSQYSFIRGALNTSFVFGNLGIGSADYDGLGNKSSTTLKGRIKLDSDVCGSTLPEHDSNHPYRIFFKIP